VVTVNEKSVTVQEALLFLKLAGQHEPDLMTEMVEEQLIAAVMAKEPPEVSDAELQAAADQFRRANRLFSAEATHRWLEETGVSEERFEDLLAHVVQRRKLKERVTADRIEPYFASHREEFTVVRSVRIDVPREAVAADLARVAREQGLLAAIQAPLRNAVPCELKVVVTERHACELPPPLSSAAPGVIVGPIVEEIGHWVAEVLDRQAAQLDASIRAVIQKRLFREWLVEQREQATVRWHWM
jgi:putative peptide maturation system protein